MPVKYKLMIHTPMRCTPYEVQAHETYAGDMHVHDMHARKVHAHETPAHHYFGSSLAQTVVDLSRSELQNTSFCASCEVEVVYGYGGAGPIRKR